MRAADGPLAPPPRPPPPPADDGLRAFLSGRVVRAQR